MNTTEPGTTRLSRSDCLPLTCSRIGAPCCHGKVVCLNPWELARLAAAKGLSSRIFRDSYCEFGGIRLRFNNPSNLNEKKECCMYLPDFGCSVHDGRPLVCRLYPLGLLRQGKELNYIHLGTNFPCMIHCPAVLDLPLMSVGEYLVGQDVLTSETAQAEYLELMQRLAKDAFFLLLETGLAASGDRLTIHLWRKLGKDNPEELAQYLGAEWIDRLMLPDNEDCLVDPTSFVCRHKVMLQSQAQAQFGNAGDFESLREASGLMMGLALHLGNSLGINPAEMSEHWIVIAKELGAHE